MTQGGAGDTSGHTSMSNTSFAISGTGAAEFAMEGGKIALLQTTGLGERVCWGYGNTGMVDRRSMTRDILIHC